MNALRTRGMRHVLIPVIDGLNGFRGAINAVLPQTQMQTPEQVRGRLCVVFCAQTLSFPSWKDRQELAAALRPSQTA